MTQPPPHSPLWKFSENSSVLVTPSVPYICRMLELYPCKSNLQINQLHFIELTPLSDPQKKIPKSMLTKASKFSQFRAFLRKFCWEANFWVNHLTFSVSDHQISNINNELQTSLSWTCFSVEREVTATCSSSSGFATILGFPNFWFPCIITLSLCVWRPL